MSEEDIDKKILFFLQNEREKVLARIQNLERELSIAKIDLASVEVRLKEEGNRLGVNPFEEVKISQTKKKGSRQRDFPLPKEMIKPEFLDLPIKEAVKRILMKRKKPLSAEEIAPLVYNAFSWEDIVRTRKIINVYLRQGVGEEGWIKVGRGKYQWIGKKRGTMPSLSTCD